jgi:hypothetical protein
MEDQFDDGLPARQAAPVLKTGFDQQSSIDPSRRVFVPIEKRTAKGTIVFQTLDKQVYARLESGEIRRATPKIHGKEAKRLRRLRCGQG